MKNLKTDVLDVNSMKTQVVTNAGVKLINVIEKENNI